MARFHHATQHGLSIWNASRQHFIEFQGGYVTTDDPIDLALLRAHSDYTHGLITEILEDHAPARPPHPRPPVPHADPPTLVGSRVISIPMRQRPALDDPSSPSPRRPGLTSIHRRRPRLPVHRARLRHRYPNGSFTKGPAPDPARAWITSSTQAPAPRRDACCAWLARFLAAGPVPSPYLHDCAARAGFSTDILWRARKAMTIQVRKTGLHSGWTWSLVAP